MTKGSTSIFMELKKRKNLDCGYVKKYYKIDEINATTKEGLKIPITMVYRKDLFKKDGSNPMYLVAYGAYGIEKKLTFKPYRLTLLDRGFIYAIASVRGGGKKGKAWHEQGKLLNKKNSFRDFIDCVEYLIQNKYTHPDRLAVFGASSGATLMAVAANMRPDLFKLVMLDVPAVDDLTYFLNCDSTHFGYHFAEFGNPQEKKYFDYIFSYDPYQNIKSKNYPHMLVTGGINDRNVPYWQPLKYVSKLRVNNTNDNLILLKMNTGGHEGIKDPDEYLKEIAFVFSYMFKVLNINN